MKIYSVSDPEFKAYGKVLEGYDTQELCAAMAATEMPEIVVIAQNHGVHPAIICLKWAVQRGELVIPFSTNERNYLANLQCVTEDPLTDAEMETIRQADRNFRLIKGQVFLWPGADDWRDLWDEDGVIVK